MLMYRQVDKSANMSKLLGPPWKGEGVCVVMLMLSCCVIAFLAIDDLPKHVGEQIVEEQEQERMEKQRQEWERNLCKVCNVYTHYFTQPWP